MTSGSTNGEAWVEVVDSLLDVRTDPATERFDAELAAAVADGTVSPEAAHRLRFWQRASVRALADHVRTVLPVALGALDAARHDAGQYVDESAAILAAAEADARAQAATDDADEPPAPADLTARRASATAAPDRSTLEAGSPRLLVAGLTAVPLSADRPR